ncbi:alpha/beta hydrolase [Sphingomonas sp.]|uniref:alpha/beta hydrolase n=1 Tax=Sphingomonas sp. TaxID=28214 RepID=UPI002ED7B02F
MTEGHLASFHAASQHGPRPLPLFLSLLRSETAASPEQRHAALAGLKAYQEAERPPARELAPAIARSGRARLLDYGGAGPPVVFVPSLINPPFVLDLEEGNSLLRWLATQGLRPLLVDWGTPGREARHEGLDYHIEQLMLPLIDSLGEPPLLTGYCLGGTLALAAAMLHPVRGVATIAAPWRFSRYGHLARAAIAAQWNAARRGCESLGLVPMEVLQAGFWQIDPARTVSKYEKFASTEPGSAAARAFIALEDWANSGAPLTFAAGQEMFDSFFAGDRPGAGRWWVGGKRILPARLTCPAVEFISATDRIVPAASAAGLTEQRVLHSGHVGMVVGGRAQAQLWEPLRDWLIAAAHIR